MPTPRGAGAVIVATTLSIWLAFNLVGPDEACLWTPWLGALLVAVIGWLDDVHTLSSELRLGVHCSAAIVGILGTGTWRTVTISGVVNLSLGWFGFPFTLIWIVGLINAYNFMDGIDGIAGSQAVVAGAGWFILGVLWDAPTVAGLGLVLAASSLGFLIHNWHPASIFMGDVSSGFLGYMFAILPLMQNGDSSHSVTLLPGILLVWPFLFDTILTFVRRLKNGEDVLAPHRSHLYQRLVISGFSHQTVTLLYAGLAALGLIFVLVAQWQPVAYLAAITMVVFCSAFLVLFVHRRETANHANPRESSSPIR